MAAEKVAFIVLRSPKSKHSNLISRVKRVKGPRNRSDCWHSLTVQAAMSASNAYIYAKFWLYEYYMCRQIWEFSIYESEPLKMSMSE